MPKRAPPNLDAGTFNEFLERMATESDRAALILGVSLIHELLRMALVKALAPYVPHKSQAEDPFTDGPTPLLNSFSNCIHLGHRLGLLAEDLFKDLHRLRELRNDCAHAWTAIDLSASPTRDKIQVLARHVPGTTLENVIRETPLPAWGANTREALTIRLMLGLYIKAVKELSEKAARVTSSVQLAQLALVKA